VHAFEIATHLRLTDAISDEITRLDARIEQQLTLIPGVAPACTACGLIGGGHAPGCVSTGTAVPGLAERLDEITGVGPRNAQVIIAELGTDMSVFPTAAHAAAWARLTPRTLQSGTCACRESHPWL
jgi:transposase